MLTAPMWVSVSIPFDYNPEFYLLCMSVRGT